MNKQKKLIFKISAWLFGILVFCTFISNSISNMLIPKADTSNIQEGKIEKCIGVEPELSHTEMRPVYAQADGTFHELLVKEGHEVNKGEPLYQCESDFTDITLKQAELSVMTLNNQLDKARLIEIQINQHQLQLDNAKNQLKALENEQALNAQFTKLILQIESIYNQIERLESTKDFKLDELSKKLTIAQEELRAYDGTTSIEEDNVIKKLLEAIKQLEEQISSGTLDIQQLKEANGKLEASKIELRGLRSVENIDVRREQLKLQVRDLNSQITNMQTENQINADNLSSQLQIAKNEFEVYAKNNPLNEQIEFNRAKIAIMQAEEQLKSTNLQKNEIDQIQLQLDIAKAQLVAQKKAFPEKGVFKAELSGIVYRCYVKNGDSIKKGDHVTDLLGNLSKPALKFTLPNQAGGEYSLGSRVEVNYREFQMKMPEMISESNMNSLTAQVVYKEFDEENDQYVFYATYPDDKVIPKETCMTATMYKSSSDYSTVVPVSAVSYDEKSKKNYVYVVRTREGLFSQEKYVEKVMVDVLESNNVISALRCNELTVDDIVVQYVTKPINDGDKIRVTEK